MYVKDIRFQMGWIAKQVVIYKLLILGRFSIFRTRMITSFLFHIIKSAEAFIVVRRRRNKKKKKKKKKGPYIWLAEVQRSQ